MVRWLAVPVVLFGNRNYDDALIELRNILAADGMHPIAAGALLGEHSFSRVLERRSAQCRRRSADGRNLLPG